MPTLQADDFICGDLSDIKNADRKEKIAPNTSSRQMLNDLKAESDILFKFQEIGYNTQSSKLQERPSGFRPDTRFDLVLGIAKSRSELAVDPVPGVVERDGPQALKERKHTDAVNFPVKQSDKEERDGSNVSVMDLSRSNLTSISSVLGMKALRVLDLSSNRLKTIDEIGALRYLVDLNVSYNLLEEIASSVALLSRLEVLRLEGNKISSLERSTATLSAVINLRQLNLSQNDVTNSEGYREYVIRRLPMLTKLDEQEVTIEERRRIQNISQEVTEGSTPDSGCTKRRVRGLFVGNTTDPRRRRPESVHRPFSQARLHRRDERLRDLESENSALRLENQSMKELLNKKSLEMARVCDIFYEMRQELALLNIDKQFDLDTADLVLKGCQDSGVSIEKEGEKVDQQALRGSELNSSTALGSFCESPYIGTKTRGKGPPAVERSTEMNFLAMSKVHRAAFRYKMISLRIQHLMSKKVRVEKHLEMLRLELERMLDGVKDADDGVLMEKRRCVKSLELRVKELENCLMSMNTERRESKAIITGLDPSMLEECFEMGEMIGYLRFLLEEKEEQLETYQRELEEKGSSGEELMSIWGDGSDEDELKRLWENLSIEKDKKLESGVEVDEMGQLESSHFKAERLNDRVKRLEAENALLREIDSIDLMCEKSNCIVRGSAQPGVKFLSKVKELCDLNELNETVDSNLTLKMLRRRKIESAINLQIEFLCQMLLARMGALFELYSMDSVVTSRACFEESEKRSQKIKIRHMQFFLCHMIDRLKKVNTAFGGLRTKTPHSERNNNANTGGSSKIFEWVPGKINNHVVEGNLHHGGFYGSDSKDENECAEKTEHSDLIKEHKLPSKSDSSGEKKTSRSQVSYRDKCVIL